MKNGFISRALIISSTRFIALSLPLCDMIMLGHQGNEYVKNFSVAAQLSQVFVILSIMLSIGINIVVGKSHQEKKKYIQGVFRYSIYLAICLVIISLIITPVFYNHIEMLKIYLIFSISIFPLCIYIGFANILETIKLERKILIITLYSSVANVILNYALINWMSNSAIAVSLSTCFIRILILFPVVNLLLKQKIKLSPKKIPGLNKEIFILGRSAAITSLCFTGGLSILVMYITNNMKSEYSAFFGLALNFMNTISVIFVGMTISLTISLSKNNGNIESITIINIKKSMLYITSFSLLFYLITPLLPYVYLGNENKMLTQFFVLSIGVVAFDGIAQTFISTLLVYGMSQLPPLFRLSLIFIGIPMSFFFTIDENPIANIIKFMMLGNMLASVFSIIYFIKCFPQIKKKRTNSH
ncbi:MATE family efflux transporter [Xenorhabdus anantnagensis]|uniref:MATE family efflux transporter n=1 Tax=Xenorhabdus anantnagensis TaxID=3025875 RepID=A0ABT5LTV1_9GAMM|nr:MATE family efflux transporter [Xenorhabdus anantnagensis]MDC9597849.1 MATE family efflux transporter [Xenorhabdus anantnagensis]